MEWIIVRLLAELVSRAYAPLQRANVIPRGIASLAHSVSALDHRTRGLTVPPDAVKTLLELRLLAAEVRSTCCFIPPSSDLGIALSIIDAYPGAVESLNHTGSADLMRVPIPEGTAIVSVRMERHLPPVSGALEEEAA